MRQAMPPNGGAGVRRPINFSRGDDRGTVHLPCPSQEDDMPTITTDTSRQTVITTFEVTPGTCHDLRDELTEAYARFISQQPGFIGAGIHVNDAQTRVASYSQWHRREDFLAMLRTDEMRVRNRRINDLCKSFAPVMYDVVATYG
jgi:heme-degrading monooxygenase HmoA